MKKPIKKSLRCFAALLLCAVALGSMATLSSCGRKKTVTAKIGVLRGDSSSEEALSWEKYLRDLAGEMGVQIDFTTALESADQELAAVQNYASQGYNGILTMTSYNPINILKKCQEYKMYMVVGAAHPDFEDSEKTLSKDESVVIKDYSAYPYYVGAAGPSNYGEVLAGEQMGRAGVEKGYTKYSIFTGAAAYGQAMHALRIAGFFIALHEDDPTVTYAGIECSEGNWKALTLQIEKDLGVKLSSFQSEKYQILAQTGGYSFLQGDTAAVTAVSQLSSVKGVEAVFCAGSSDGVSSFAPKDAKCVYIGNDSLGTTFENLFRDGKLVFDIAKYRSYPGPAFAMLLRSIYRDEAVRIGGKPVSLEQQSLPMMAAEDYATVNEVESKEGGYFYSAEFLSAYIMETDLGESIEGYSKIDDVAFTAITTLPATLNPGGLYAVTRAVSEAFIKGGNSIFRFSAETNENTQTSPEMQSEQNTQQSGEAGSESAAEEATMQESNQTKTEESLTLPIGGRVGGFF